MDTEKTVNTTESAVSDIEIFKNNLTEEQKKTVAAYADSVDISDTTAIIAYGADAQQKIADFSDTALGNVRGKDLGEVGDMISSLVTELRNFTDVKEKKGFFALFRRAKSKLDLLKARYSKAEENVNGITAVLENHQVQLIKDTAMLDKLYEANLDNYNNLTLYIIAGKEKLDAARSHDLPALTEKAKETGLPADAQAANDFAAACERFDKRLHDLELTRTVAMQMAPQIRLVQNNDTVMSEKIQTTLVNTIPLWKSQMVIALGLAHSQEALEAQRKVTDMTNELLKKNADALKTGTVETAIEAERGIVDIETLKYTNESLISTLDEVLRIQDEGRANRRAAEAELAQIEDSLKKKLLEIRG